MQTLAKAAAVVGSGLLAFCVTYTARTLLFSNAQPAPVVRVVAPPCPRRVQLAPAPMPVPSQPHAPTTA